MLPRIFGTLSSGEAVKAYRLENVWGAFVEVLTYGAIITKVGVMDRSGQIGDVVLGFDQLAPYLENTAYVGALVGRIAGRIYDGQLSVGDREYRLPCNSGVHHLHGGRTGLHRRLWRAQAVSVQDGGAALQLTYTSPDGEEGYPGSLDIAVTYTLTPENALVVDTFAASYKPTPVSLTQHSYFNLGGEGSGTVADHTLQILADTIVPTDDHMTLCGRCERVVGQPSDFTRPRKLGPVLPRLFKRHGDLYLLRAAPTEAFLPTPFSPIRVARLAHDSTGRALEVFTDQPCLQFYSGVSLDGSLVGKSGRNYGPHAGLCLECQGYPEATRHSGFGDILVYPGKPQWRRTVYAFSTF